MDWKYASTSKQRVLRFLKCLFGHFERHYISEMRILPLGRDWFSFDKQIFRQPGPCHLLFFIFWATFLQSVIKAWGLIDVASRQFPSILKFGSSSHDLRIDLRPTRCSLLEKWFYWSVDFTLVFLVSSLLANFLFWIFLRITFLILLFNWLLFQRNFIQKKILFIKSLSSMKLSRNWKMRVSLYQQKLNFQLSLDLLNFCLVRKSWVN